MILETQLEIQREAVAAALANAAREIKSAVDQTVGDVKESADGIARLAITEMTATSRVALQEGLSILGTYKGKFDAEIGPKSQQAIERAIDTSKYIHERIEDAGMMTDNFLEQLGQAVKKGERIEDENDETTPFEGA